MIGIGSYHGGISMYHQDPDTGQLRRAGESVTAAEPSFLAWHPTGRHLYAVGERNDGTVTAFDVAESGGLRELGSQPTGGTGPCHVSVHPAGRHVLSANYGSGSIAVHPIDGDGRLGARTDLVQHAGSGPDPDRQAGPHAHNVQTDPAGRHVYAVDLGTDEVRCYRLDHDGTLETGPVARAERGAGPRHLAFHPRGRVYVADELASTVSIYEHAPISGVLSRIGSVPATVDTDEIPARNYPSEIAVSADGRFVYVANRGRDCISVFSVDDGTLKPVADVACEGAWPRHFAIVGDFLYVANQNSDAVACFRIDDGVPSYTGHSIAVPSPACVSPSPR